MFEQELRQLDEFKLSTLQWTRAPLVPSSRPKDAVVFKLFALIFIYIFNILYNNLS